MSLVPIILNLVRTVDFDRLPSNTLQAKNTHASAYELRELKQALSGKRFLQDFQDCTSEYGTAEQVDQIRRMLVVDFRLVEVAKGWSEVLRREPGVRLKMKVSEILLGLAEEHAVRGLMVA